MPIAGSGPKEEASTSLISLRIIEVMLEESGSWGVSELAERLAIPKARVHRHLSQLGSAGYVRHSARRYEIGWRLLLLGARISTQASAARIARPVMEELRNSVRQTIVFSQMTEAAVVVMEVVPGGSPIDVVLQPGTQFGFNAAAQGKIALAFGSPDQLATWSSLEPEERTERTIIDREALAQQVAVVRELGWAAAPDETYVGVNALAAPVRSAGGALLGTLAIVGSIHYLPDPPPEEVVSSLLDAASRLSADFGYESATSTEEE